MRFISQIRNAWDRGLNGHTNIGLVNGEGDVPAPTEGGGNGRIYAIVGGAIAAASVLALGTALTVRYFRGRKENKCEGEKKEDPKPPTPPTPPTDPPKP